MNFPLFSLTLLLPMAAFAAPGLTIYNQDFAVVRDTVPLELREAFGRALRRLAGEHAV